MLSFIYDLATDRRKGPIAGIIKLFLYLASLIYGLVVRVFIFIYRRKPYRLNCKVISIGNITLGGTGKTTLVLLIARYLKDKGHKVAILSRGYKRKVTRYELPVTNYENMGDEPYMLKTNLKDVPVLVDADRIRAAKLAMRDYAVDTVILDDGFQQWRIKKDMEIVTIDATCPFGNRRIIPRGILREPLSSLKRADMFVLTKTNLKPLSQDIKNFLSSINPQAPIIESVHSPVFFYEINKANELLNINIFQGKIVTLFSGIGDPDSFENLIKSLGINTGLSLRFRDHHNYTTEDLNNIIRRSKEKDIATVITTEKDAIRLRGLQLITSELQFLFLRIELKIIKDEQEFYNRLLRIYSH